MEGKERVGGQPMAEEIQKAIKSYRRERMKYSEWKSSKALTNFTGSRISCILS